YHLTASLLRSLLSLHDALPISLLLRILRSPGDVNEQIPLTERLEKDGEPLGVRGFEKRCVSRLDLLVYLVCRNVVWECVRRHGLDRKSTRLDSSHVKSSYAGYR